MFLCLVFECVYAHYNTHCGFLLVRFPSTLNLLLFPNLGLDYCDGNTYDGTGYANLYITRMALDIITITMVNECIPS